MPEIEFEAKPSGDMECFCWDVTEEEYKRVVGKDDYQFEKEYREESHHEEYLRESGLPPSPWFLYPGHILRAMGFDPSKSESLRVKMIVEKIEA